MSLQSPIARDSSGCQELYAQAEAYVTIVSDTVARVTVSAQAFMKHSYQYGVRCWTTINNSSRAYGGGGYLSSEFYYFKDIPGTWTQQTADFARGANDYTVPVQFGFEGILVNGIGAWPASRGWLERAAYHLTIPAIPYAVSDFKSLPVSANIGSDLSVGIAPQGNVTHTVDVIFGGATASASGAIGVGTILVPLSLDLCNQIPNNTSGTATVVLKTYFQGALIGSNQRAITLYVPSSVVPTAGSLSLAHKYTASNPPVPASWGLLIQSRSGIIATAAGGDGAHGSTIKRITISGAGQSGGGDLGTGETQKVLSTSAINATGVVPFTAVYTDSRGRTASRTVNSGSFAAYSLPIFNSVSIRRADVSGDPDLNGTYGQVTVDASFSQYLGGAQSDNSVHTLLEYKDATLADLPANWTTVTNGFSLSGNTTFGAGGIDPLKSYDVKLSMWDWFGETDPVTVQKTYELKINPAVPIQHFSASGNIGIQSRAGEAALTVGGDVAIDGDAAIDGELTIGTPLAVTEGGTGATTVAGARTNLHAQQDLNEVTSIELGGGRTDSGLALIDFHTRPGVDFTNRIVCQDSNNGMYLYSDNIEITGKTPRIVGTEGFYTHLRNEGVWREYCAHSIRSIGYTGANVGVPANSWAWVISVGIPGVVQLAANQNNCFDGQTDHIYVTRAGLYEVTASARLNATSGDVGVRAGVYNVGAGTFEAYGNPLVQAASSTGVNVLTNKQYISVVNNGRYLMHQVFSSTGCTLIATGDNMWHNSVTVRPIFFY